MATLRQTSFAAGELSPLLWGRTDSELYAHGARRLKNFIVTPQGAAASRPGTRLLVAAKTKDVVLVPFVFSDSISYVLELGAGYLRVHHPESGYIGVELSTPYLVENLASIQWAQVGGRMIFTHPAHPAQELLSPSAVVAAWAIREARFRPEGQTPTTAQSMVPIFATEGGSLRLGPLIVHGTDPTKLFVLDAAHPPREWRWKVSAILRNSLTGEEVETQPMDIIEYFDGATRASVKFLPADGFIVLAADAPVLFRHPTFGPVIGALFSYANWVPSGIVYYRGRGGLYGKVGETAWAQDFLDVGDEPNYAIQPLRGSAPFVAGEHPGAAAYFQQRRVFAGSAQRPATLWASATDAWANFDRNRRGYLTADGPIEATVAGRKREAIRALVVHSKLLAFTDASVWSIEYLPGTDSASVFLSRVEDEVGSTRLAPLVVDGSVLYVKAKGRGVRALTLNDGGFYQARDITTHAEHLFREPTSEIVSWCFQRDPWATIWAVRADGTLLTATRTGSTMWAWTPHELAGGLVRSVSCVPSARADMVVAAVTRGGDTFLERLYLRDRETLLPLDETTTPGEAAYSVDCASTFTLNVGDTLDCYGLQQFEGQQVWAVAPGNAPQGPLTVLGGQVTIGPFDVSNLANGGVLALVGAAFTPELQTLDATGLQQKTVVKVGFEVDQSQGIYAGQDFEHLVPWRQRDVQDSYEFPGYASELVVVAVKGAWRRHGRACLRQSQPLPVTVLGVSREVEAGGS